MAKKTFNLRDGKLTIKDADTTPNSFEVVLDDGDLSIEIPGTEVKDIRDRGVPDHTRLGNIQYMSFSFSAKFSGLTDTSDTLYEVLIGEGTSWVYDAETGTGYDLQDGGDVEFVQLYFEVTKDTTTETILIPNVPLPSISFREGDDVNMLSISGTSYQQRPIVSAA